MSSGSPDRGAEDAVLAMGPRIRALPVVHGSADFSLAVRDAMLARRFDCVAVPLPPTLEEEVLAGVDELPRISAVVQACDAAGETLSYVPIDPCQPVIRAIRMARQERIPVRFVDHPGAGYHAEATIWPDPYALKALSPARFFAAVLPFADAPEPESFRDRRCRHMAFELNKLELEHEAIFFVPSVLDYAFIRDAHARRAPYPEVEPFFAPVARHPVDRETLAFFLGELPWITHLYERLRHGLGEETTLGVDGVKELALEARDRLVRRRAGMRKRVTLETMRTWLQYVRNLTLVRGRLRPDLFTLAEAAKQVFGDDYAIELIETAKDYPPQPKDVHAPLRMAPGRAELPEQGVRPMESRLPGDVVTWRSIDLVPAPPEPDREAWSRVWDPRRQCSWPPEDVRIESFNRHVRQQAIDLLRSDFAQVEKFSASVKDGIDVRETLRNWHSGEIWVKELPPARGGVDVVVFLFDVPADPDRYPWRTTWFAENQNESTLVFFATDFMSDMIGPGIGQARYGGAFFVYPPRPLPDVWQDASPRFRRLKTLEERLLFGAFAHARERHVAIVAPCPLKASWRALARSFGVRPIHLPLSRFSTSVVDRLRTFHVLNGRKVRSYAADFIRRPE